MEAVELRWVSALIPNEGYPIYSENVVGDTGLVLQVRERKLIKTRKNFFQMHCSPEWSEWRDVPVVEE